MTTTTPVPVRIVGAGTALPPGPPVSNADILRLDEDHAGHTGESIDRMAERLEAKYGVARRFLASPPWRPRTDAVTSESLAGHALQAARSLAPDARPDVFILGSTTSSRYTGSQAAAVLGRFGIVAAAYDIKAGCSTSLASLHLAVTFLQSGAASVAVACAETLSKVMHPDVRETWFGLADGGAALWLVRDDERPDFVIRTSSFTTDGRHVNLFTTPGVLPPADDVEAARTHAFALSGDGARLGALSRDRYAVMLDELLPTAADRDAIDWLVPHQVNLSLIREVTATRVPRARLVWDAREHGNLGGASILFSLARAVADGRFQRGERILLMSVGGGLSSAAQIWERV